MKVASLQRLEELGELLSDVGRVALDDLATPIDLLGCLQRHHPCRGGRHRGGHLADRLLAGGEDVLQPAIRGVLMPEVTLCTAGNSTPITCSASSSTARTRSCPPSTLIALTWFSVGRPSRGAPSWLPTAGRSGRNSPRPTAPDRPRRARRSPRPARWRSGSCPAGLAGHVIRLSSPRERTSLRSLVLASSSPPSLTPMTSPPTSSASCRAVSTAFRS